MFDIVFANGCSYTQGNSLGGKNLPAKPVAEVPGRFSERVAKHFDADHYNIAAGGAGQDKIFRTTIDWIELNKDILENKKVLFILGLSEPARGELYVNSIGDYSKFNLYSDDSIVQRISTDSDSITKEEIEDFAKLYLTEFFNDEERIKLQHKLIKALIAYINIHVPNNEVFIFNSLGKFPDWFREDLGLDDTFKPSWDSYIVNFKLNPPGVGHPREGAHMDMGDYIILKYDERYG